MLHSIPFRVEKGELVYNRQSYLRFVQDNEGKSGDIAIKQRDRSLSQLRMYRVWLKQAADQTGNNEEELHEFLLDKCAPKVVVTIKGKANTHEITKSKRTSGGHSLSMTKLEMGEYLDKCAALTECPLPTKQELEAMGYVVEWN